MKTLPGTLIVVALCALAAAPSALAQVGNVDALKRRPAIGPQQQLPDVAPWDKALRRYYEREKILRPQDPLAKTERSVRGLFDDPARKLGLPDQNSPDALRPTPLAPAPGLPADIVALDRNSNGSISRREYMEQRFRSRPVAPGPAAEARRRNVFGRVHSRFDGADTDRNGILDAGELRGVIDPRF